MTARKRASSKISPAEIQQIARSTARVAAKEAVRSYAKSAQPSFDEDHLTRVIGHAVKEGFRAVGMNPDDPLETQKDLAYLRTWRTAMNKTGAKAMSVAVTFLTLAFLASILSTLGVPHRILVLIGLAQ